MSYASLVRKDTVPQTQPLDVRQVKNNAGGYVFEIDVWARLDRFLVLGSDSATYYQSARAITRENAKVVEDCWKADFRRTADRIVEISVAGRAPKNSPAIFALAVGSMAEAVEARQAALAAVQKVCRTASHLFEFATLVDALGRGWGRALTRTVKEWYEGRTPDDLGYQMTKYRVRQDYTHKRLIQRVRPPAADNDEGRIALYRWACERDLQGHALPNVVVAHLDAMKAEKASELIPLIEKHRLSWEAVPTWALKDAKVWEALLPGLGLTALLRNLGTLSDVGVIKSLGSSNDFVIDRLTDEVQIKKARLHPYAILQALAVYRSGRSVKGERTWKVATPIVDALDRAFYMAFDNVEPTGKRYLKGLDVSGSMGTSMIGGVISAREAAAAMAMVTARKERNHEFYGFTQDGSYNQTFEKLDVSASMDLGTVMKNVHKANFGRTDCAMPMLHALKHGLEVDVFEIYTDNETYAGSIHPVEALKKYRKETGIAAKLVVVATTSTGFSIADPKDAGMLDVVGFDSAAVSVIGDFVRA